MQAEQTKRNLLIWGLDEEADEDVKQVVKDFFKLKMEIEKDIQITKAYRRGKKEVTGRQVLVELSEMTDKFIIYKHLKNLKEKTNNLGKKFTVRDDLPPARLEADRRQRQLLAQNRKKMTGQLDMTIKKKKLMVNNQVYKKLAPTPTSAEVLNPQEHEMVQSTKVVSTKEHKEKGNIFFAYATEANNIQQIHAVYWHIKVKHVDAQHIAMAHIGRRDAKSKRV